MVVSAPPNWRLLRSEEVAASYSNYLFLTAAVKQIYDKPSAAQPARPARLSCRGTITSLNFTNRNKLNSSYLYFPPHCQDPQIFYFEAKILRSMYCKDIKCFICTRDICNRILQAMDATLCYARPDQVARRAACTAARHTCAGRRD